MCRFPPCSHQDVVLALSRPDFSSSDFRFVFFFINLFMALMTVESLMMAIAAVVPHYLMGIAGEEGGRRGPPKSDTTKDDATRFQR